MQLIWARLPFFPHAVLPATFPTGKCTIAAPAATRIVLPLRAGHARGVGAGAGLLQRFQDVRPHLLLFLQRLRRLALTRIEV